MPNIVRSHLVVSTTDVMRTTVTDFFMVRPFEYYNEKLHDPKVTSCVLYEIYWWPKSVQVRVYKDNGNCPKWTAEQVLSQSIYNKSYSIFYKKGAAELVD